MVAVRILAFVGSVLACVLALLGGIATVRRYDRRGGDPKLDATLETRRQALASAAAAQRNPRHYETAIVAAKRAKDSDAARRALAARRSQPARPGRTTPPVSIESKRRTG